jgi:hypothetical protein
MVVDDDGAGIEAKFGRVGAEETRERVLDESTLDESVVDEPSIDESVVVEDEPSLESAANEAAFESVVVVVVVVDEPILESAGSEVDPFNNDGGAAAAVCLEAEDLRDVLSLSRKVCRPT